MTENKLAKRQRPSTTSDEAKEDVKKRKIEVKPVIMPSKEDPIMQKIKLLFYNLADPDEKIRKDALKTLVDIKLNDDQEMYALHRLVSGCAAGGRASRLAYPPALSILIKKSDKKFTVEDMVKIAEEKLPIDGKCDNYGEIIGTQLFYTAVINSGKFNTAIDLLKIAKILHGFYKKHKHVRFAIAMALVDIAKIVGEHYYSPHFMPVNLLPASLATLEELEPEQFFILLSLRKVLQDDGYACKKFFGDGKFLFKPDTFPIIQQLLRKSTAGCERYPLAGEIYLAAVDSGISFKIIKEIFYPAFHLDVAGNNPRDTHFFFKLVDSFLDRRVFLFKDVQKLFSDTVFLSKIGQIVQCKRFGVDTVYGGIVKTLLNTLQNYLKIQNLSQEKLADFMVSSHILEMDDDAYEFYVKTIFTNSLFNMLNEEGLKFVVAKMLENPQEFIVNQLFDRLPLSHDSFPIEHRIELIQKSAHPPMSLIHESLIQIFTKPFRETQTVILSKIGEEKLRMITEKFAEIKIKKIKESDVEVKKQYDALRNISMLMSLIQALTSSHEEAEFCEKMSDEMDSIIERKRIDIDEIYACICRFVPRKGRLFRYSAFYLTTVFAHLSTIEVFGKFIDIIKKSDWAIVTGDEEDGAELDDEFAPITCDELNEIQKKREQNAENDDSDDEMELSDQDGEEEDDVEMESEEENAATAKEPLTLIPDAREPHPQMLAALQRALGKLAATENSDEEDDVEMNDEEIAAIDARLTNVMKCFTTKGKKQMIQEAKSYRVQIAEVLNLTVENADVNVVLQFLPAYYELLSNCDGSGREDYVNAVVACIFSLNRRTVDPELDVSKIAFKLFKELCETSEKLHNTQVQGGLAKVAHFLYRLIEVNDSLHKQLLKFIVKQAEKYFTEGNRSSLYKIVFEIVRRYESLFVSSFGLFFELFTKTTKGKKSEAAHFIALFNRKDLIAANQKVLAAPAAEIFKHFDAVKPEEGGDSFTAAMKLFLSETLILRT